MLAHSASYNWMSLDRRRFRSRVRVHRRGDTLIALLGLLNTGATGAITKPNGNNAGISVDRKR